MVNRVSSFFPKGGHSATDNNMTIYYVTVKVNWSNKWLKVPNIHPFFKEDRKERKNDKTNISLDKIEKIKAENSYSWNIFR